MSSDPRIDPIMTRGVRTRTLSRREGGGINQKAQTPKKPEQKKKQHNVVKFAKRKYFSVEEDWAILSYWSGNKENLSTREISDNLTEKIDHSSESIRDRIKRYISKLKRFDMEMLEEEAKVSFFFFF